MIWQDGFCAEDPPTKENLTIDFIFSALWLLFVYLSVALSWVIWVQIGDNWQGFAFSKRYFFLRLLSKS